MRQRLRDERGMSTVQVAILFPAVLIWLMLIVQYGLWWHAKQVANAAASEGVEAAQVGGASESDGEAAVAKYLAEAGNLDNVTVTVDRQAEVVIVEVRGEAPQLVPGISWSVAARSTEPVERFIPEGER
jgi:Flp pilus assembly protein TadG